MPGPLKNSRHERFAQELAKGKAQHDAFMAAGFSARGNAARANASRLLTDANVSARVLELKGRAAEKVTDKVAIDSAWVLKKAVELHKITLKDKAYSAAKGSLELVGKHVAVQAFSERIEHAGAITINVTSEDASL